MSSNNPFSGTFTLNDTTIHSGSAVILAAPTSYADKLVSFGVTVESQTIDIPATLAKGTRTQAVGSDQIQVAMSLSLELAEILTFHKIHKNRNLLTAVYRPRSGPAALDNPEQTVVFPLSSAPTIPGNVDEHYVWEVTVVAQSLSLTNGTDTVAYNI